MDLKKELENRLRSLHFKGYDRGKIESSLGYSENYIDQVLVKGVSRKFLNAVIALDERVLENPTDSGKRKDKSSDYHDLYIDSLKEQKRILEVQNEFLRRNFETSLNSIAEGQAVTHSQLKALSWYQAVVANGGDERKAEAALVKMGNKAAWYSGLSQQARTGRDGGKRSKG